MDNIYALIEKSKRAVRYWWLMLIVGVVLWAVAVWILVNPELSFLGMAMVFGWVMLGSGILEIIVTAANKNIVTGRSWVLTGAIIEIVLGLIMINNTALSESILPIYLGFWLLFRGVMAIGISGDMRTLGIPGSIWSLVNGVLVLLVSFWVLTQPLVFGQTAVVIWVGISLLFAGVSAILFSLQIKQAHRYLNRL
jgi:uncharacterized membrane protein HdeD (DUF308 family)